MTNELDPRVVQLFEEQEQPLDARQFVLQLTAELERQELRMRWRRRAGLGTALLVLGLALPWLLRETSALLSEIAMNALFTAEAATPELQWLMPALLCAFAFGFGTVWRLTRGTE